MNGQSGGQWTTGYAVSAGFDSKTGQLLWGPTNRTEVPWARLSGLLYAIGPAGEGVWCEYTSETFSWDAYSLTTGQHLWGPVSGSHNAYSYQNIHADIAYGTLFAADLGGYSTHSISLMVNYCGHTPLVIAALKHHMETGRFST